MIAIIGAQYEEIKGIINLMETKVEKDFYGFQCFEGTIQQQPVIVAKSKVGSVACSVLMSLLFSHYPISFSINVGTAGSFKATKMKPGTVIVGEHLSYYDVDLTFFGHYEYGQMAACPRFFESTHHLVEQIRNKSWSFPLAFGTILSGEKFVTAQQDVLKIIDHEFENSQVYAIDMESTYFAQVCYLFNQPFLVVRVISDLVDGEQQAYNYEKVLEISSHYYRDIVLNLVQYHAISTSIK